LESHYTKHDEKLFRRYTRNAQVRLLTKYLFADDGALLATSRDGMERAVQQYKSVGADFGQTGVERHRKCQAAGRGRRSTGSKEVMCPRCNRAFGREGDMQRHKCLNERRKPLHLQKGAIQFLVPHVSGKGGLAVHKCHRF